MATGRLGTLTVDLVANTVGWTQGLSKAERDSKQWRQNIERNMKRVARTAATAAVAISGAMAAAITKYTRDGMHLVQQQNAIAKSVDSTYDSITSLRLAFGASGIEDFSGSLSRMNRRLGAAQMGSGAAAKTVKTLGLDLKQMADMDVHERIATIADRIKAVAHNSQMAAAFARDLGFQQKEAATFFAQGGDAIREYVEWVDRLGLSLSDIQADRVDDVGEAMLKIEAINRSLKEHMAAEFAPAILTFIEYVSELTEEFGGMGEVAKKVVDGIIKGIGYVANYVDLLRRQFIVLSESGRVVQHAMHGAMAKVSSYIHEYPIRAVNSLLGLLNRIPGISINMLRIPKSAGDLSKKAEESFNKAAASIARIREQFNKPLASTRMNNAIKKTSAKLDGMGRKSRKFGSEFSKDFDTGAKRVARGAKTAQKAVEDLSNKMDELLKRRESLIFSLANETERAHITYKKTLEEIGELEAGNALTSAEAIGLRSRAYERLQETLDRIKESQEEELTFWEQWLEKAKESLESFDELKQGFLDTFERGFGDMFEKIIVDGESVGQSLRNMMLGLLRVTINTLGQMAGRWIMLQSVQRMTEKSAKASAAATMGSNAQAQSLQAGINAYASAAAVPMYGYLMAPAAMASALAATQPLASMVQAMAAVGMAHDGIESVPKTGTWLLEKGERVVTAKTSANLDRTLSDIKSGAGGVKIINVFDPSIVGDYLSTADGEKLIVNTMAKNRQLLGG